jgi:hypothetical protein
LYPKIADVAFARDIKKCCFKTGKSLPYAYASKLILLPIETIFEKIYEAVG